jgi:hypothetical protein
MSVKEALEVALQGLEVGGTLKVHMAPARVEVAHECGLPCFRFWW